jgi:hypothetical protein
MSASRRDHTRTLGLSEDGSDVHESAAKCVNRAARPCRLGRTSPCTDNAYRIWRSFCHPTAGTAGKPRTGAAVCQKCMPPTQHVQMHRSVSAYLNPRPLPLQRWISNCFFVTRQLAACGSTTRGSSVKTGILRRISAFP